MSTMQSEYQCPDSPIGEHLFKTDRGDRRFKVCTYCGMTSWRTDEDLITDTGVGKKKGKHAAS